MKKGDIYIMITTLVIALVVYLGYNLSIDESLGRQAVIKSNGKVVTSLDVDATTSASYRVDNDYGYNVIYIEEGKVHIEEASCKNQLCVYEGDIEGVGQTLVCLPNRVTVEIIGKKADDVDGVSY